MFYKQHLREKQQKNTTHQPMANELLSTNKIFKTCLQIPDRDMCLSVCVSRVCRCIQAYIYTFMKFLKSATFLWGSVTWELVHHWINCGDSKKNVATSLNPQSKLRMVRVSYRGYFLKCLNTSITSSDRKPLLNMAKHKTGFDSQHISLMWSRFSPQPSLSNYLPVKHIHTDWDQ